MRKYLCFVELQCKITYPEKLNTVRKTIELSGNEKVTQVVRNRILSELRVIRG